MIRLDRPKQNSHLKMQNIESQSIVRHKAENCLDICINTNPILNASFATDSFYDENIYCDIGNQDLFLNNQVLEIRNRFDAHTSHLFTPTTRSCVYLSSSEDCIDGCPDQERSNVQESKMNNNKKNNCRKVHFADVLIQAIHPIPRIPPEDFFQLYYSCHELQR